MKTKKQIIGNMKRIVLLLAILMMPVLIEAKDVYRFKTTEYAYKTKKDNKWGDWTDWMSVSASLVIDTQKKKITLGDEKTYYIRESLGLEKESDGGKVLTFRCFDNDADDCKVRLRVTKDDDWQLYVDFDTIMIVYNLEER